MFIEQKSGVHLGNTRYILWSMDPDSVFFFKLKSQIFFLIGNLWQILQLFFTEILPI